MNFFPDISKFNSSINRRKTDYTLLQQLLGSFDRIFYLPIMEKTDYKSPFKELNVCEFYNNTLLETAMKKVNILDNASNAMTISGQKITYKKYFLKLWDEVKENANHLLKSPLIQEETELWHLINELIGNPALDEYFSIIRNSENNFIMKNFSWVYVIIELHQTAFDKFELLNSFHSKKSQTRISKPLFYKK